MKKYCHKESIESVANEVRTRNGTSALLAFNDISSTIRGLLIPVDRGAPNIELTSSNPIHQIQRGKYSGGSVFVTSENVTAVLTRDGGNVQINHAAASVTVPAKNTFSYASGLITPSDNSSSVQITGLSFSPVGFVVMCTSPNYKVTSYDNAIATVCCYKSGSGYATTGFLPNQLGYLGIVTSASASFGGNSFSVSNIVGSRNGTSYNCIFRNREFSWFAWG